MAGTRLGTKVSSQVLRRCWSETGSLEGPLT